MRVLREYPKLLALCISILIAYIAYQQGAFHWIDAHLNGYSYLSIFLGGILFSFGFTSPFAFAYFVEIAAHVNPFIAALLAGCGAALSDMSIFSVAKLSFHDEYLRLQTTHFYQRIRAVFHHESISDLLRFYLRWLIAGIIIASPLPDEIGISFVLGMTSIQPRRLAMLCFLLNTLGILLILIATRAIAS